jgi:hypothetical protein
LSDVIFDLYGAGLFSAKWTDSIEAEFLRNWSMVVYAARRTASKSAPPLSAAEAAKIQSKAANRLRCYKHAAHEYEVFGYDDPSVIAQLPAAIHKGDKHVAAAAIVLLNYAKEFGGPDKILIVSANLKHLAVKEMRALGIEVVRPGEFIDLLFAADPVKVAAALNKTRMDLNTPPLTQMDLLSILKLHGAKATVRHFSKLWNITI